MPTAPARLLALAVLFAAPLLATMACTRTSRGGGDPEGSTGDAAADSTTTDGESTTTDDAPTTTVGESTTTGATTSRPSTTEDSDGADTTGSATESSTSTGSTGEDPLGNCCEPQRDPGCDVPDVADCVCAEDPYCCVVQWDAHCAIDVTRLGCGECPT